MTFFSCFVSVRLLLQKCLIFLWRKWKVKLSIINLQMSREQWHFVNSCCFSLTWTQPMGCGLRVCCRVPGHRGLRKSLKPTRTRTARLWICIWIIFIFIYIFHGSNHLCAHWDRLPKDLWIKFYISHYFKIIRHYSANSTILKYFTTMCGA